MIVEILARFESGTSATGHGALGVNAHCDTSIAKIDWSFTYIVKFQRR